MNPHLFVYGSLSTVHGHPMGNRLRQEALLIGPARMDGRLHRVGWFPGLRPAEAPGEMVHGEVYRLTDALKSIAWLDAYEGITPGGSSAAAANTYLRAERAALLPSGATLIAWVYLYQRPLPADTHIPDGIWRG